MVFGPCSTARRWVPAYLHRGDLKNRLGWAHQTYAEFLAALSQKRHQMPAEQVRSLLFHPGAGGQNLIPQLRELASWTSALNTRVFDVIADAEPEALLVRRPQIFRMRNVKLL